MTPADLLTKNLQLSIAAKQDFLNRTDQIESFARAANEVIDAYRLGGRLYLAGNGGSAADAQHIAAELVVRLAKDRRPLPAEALTTDSSILTAIGNDYGYEAIFARQIEAKLRAGDVFLGISTSGNSPNILAALRQCRAQNIPSILFSGRDGGPARALADHCILVSGDDTSTIQELHIVLGHTLCEAVERAVLDIAAR
jgi:D-sedoheptulose 7-phosphate isomerase